MSLKERVYFTTEHTKIITKLFCSQKISQICGPLEGKKIARDVAAEEGNTKKKKRTGPKTLTFEGREKDKDKEEFSKN